MGLFNGRPKRSRAPQVRYQRYGAGPAAVRTRYAPSVGVYLTRNSSRWLGTNPDSHEKMLSGHAHVQHFFIGLVGLDVIAAYV